MGLAPAIAFRAVTSSVDHDRSSIDISLGCSRGVNAMLLPYPFRMTDAKSFLYLPCLFIELMLSCVLCSMGHKAELILLMLRIVAHSRRRVSASA